MEWKLTDDRPIWSQLSDLVASQIAAGVYGPGERLPSVRELAAQAQVNPNTMQRALTELERENLLVSGGTSGRTVTQDEEILTGMREDALAELTRECAEKFRAFGLTPAQAAQRLMDLEHEKEES